MQGTIFEKLEACKTLPTLPGVATEVVRLSREEEIDLNELTRVVASDPVIATKLLSTASSAVFLSRGGPPTTIQQAVLRLGANTVMTLALSFSLTRLRGTRAASFDYARFWKRALSCATAARATAELIHVHPEETFLAGLFQDIGILAMNEALGPEYADIMRAAQHDHLRLERLEREALGADHREVGAWLAQKWRLPPYLEQVTRHSHNPESASGASAFPSHTRAVALSSFIADIWQQGQRAEATRQAAECARMWIGLNGEAFTKLLTTVARALPELSRLFEVPLDHAALNQMLDEAREALVRVSLKTAQSAFEAEVTATRLAQQKEAAESQARKDALTGLFNRGYFDVALDEAFAGAQELGRPLSIVFFDVDHFKSVNDKHGHQAGDAVLQTIGRMVARCMRQLDICARYGGEEFAVILPATDRAGVAVAAERLRKLLERQETSIIGGRSLQVTASFGCATMDERFRPARAEELVKAADDAVYRAKRAGRNQVAAHEG